MTELLVAVIVCALAAHRIARAVSTDTITDRVRAWVYARAFYEPDPLPPAPDWDDVAAGIIPPPEERVAPDVQTRSYGWAYLYGGLSCPHCCGFWLSLGAWALWRNYADARVYVAAVAVAGLQSVVSAKGMVSDG